MHRFSAVASTSTSAGDGTFSPTSPPLPHHPHSTKWWSMIWKFRSGSIKEDENRAAILSPNYLNPMKQRLDKKGEPIFGRDKKPWLEYMTDWNEFEKNKTHRWSTEASRLTKLPKEYRDLLNKLKLFLSEEYRQVLCVYHPKGRNPCSDYDVSHLHIVTNSIGPDVLSRNKTVRNIQYANRRGGCGLSVRTQSIFRLDGTLAYLKADGYRFMGSNSPTLFRTYRGIRGESGGMWCTDSTFPDSDSDDQTKDFEESGTTNFGELFVTSIGKRKRQTDWDMEEDDGEGQEEVPVPSKVRDWCELADTEEVIEMGCKGDYDIDPASFKTTAELPLDRRSNPEVAATVEQRSITGTPILGGSNIKRVRITPEDALRYFITLAKESGATDEPGLRNWCVSHPDVVAKTIGVERDGPMGPFIVLAARSDYKRLVESCMMEVKRSKVSYANLIEYLKDNTTYDLDDPNLASPRESAINFLMWWEIQGMDGIIQVLKILSILLKKDVERSCFCVEGPSTCGKTYWLTKPFQRLDPVIKGEVGLDERFAFEACGNKLIILQDECNISRITAQRYKQILRGDPVQVDVKFKEPITIYKTPVMMCCNKSPVWDLTAAEGEAIKRRMHLYLISGQYQNTLKEFLRTARTPNPEMWLWFYENLDPADIDNLQHWAETGWIDVPYQSKIYIPSSCYSYMTDDEIELFRQRFDDQVVPSVSSS